MLYQKLKILLQALPYLRTVQEQNMDGYPHQRLFYGATRRLEKAISWMNSDD